MADSSQAPLSLAVTGLAGDEVAVVSASRPRGGSGPPKPPIAAKTSETPPMDRDSERPKWLELERAAGQRSRAGASISMPQFALALLQEVPVTIDL